MMRKILALAAIVLLPTIAFAAPRTLKELASQIVGLVNAATVTLLMAGIVIYLYGVGSNMFKANERGSKALSVYMLWGMGVIFVMVSIWGILSLLQNTVFGNASYNPANGGARTPSSSWDESGFSK